MAAAARQAQPRQRQRQQQQAFLELALQQAVLPRPQLQPPSPSPLGVGGGSGSQRLSGLWAQVRELLHSRTLQARHAQALAGLASSRHSFLVSDPDAVLLLSIISTELQQAGPDADDATAPLPLPPPLLLRTSAFLLLASWLRSRASSSSSSPSPRVAPSLDALVDATLGSLQDAVPSALLPEAALLLGLVCAAPDCPPALGGRARQAILLHVSALPAVPASPRAEYLLAGLGYAMTASHGGQLALLCSNLLSLWSRDGAAAPAPPLQDCMRLFRLFQHYSAALDSRPPPGATADAASVVQELKACVAQAPFSAASCAALMAAAGFLATCKEQRWRPIRQECHSLIAHVAKQLLPEVAVTDFPHDNGHGHGNGIGNSNVRGDVLIVGEPWALLQPLTSLPPHVRHCLQCLALAVAHSGPSPANHSILGCLLSSLLRDLLNLAHLFSAVESDISARVSTACTLELQRLDDATHNPLFGEVGAVARAFCGQYISCSAYVQRFTETVLWRFSRSLYATQRVFHAFRHMLLPVLATGSHLATQAVDRISETAFLFLVVFFSLAVEGSAGRLGDTQPLLAAQALDALSCLEFARKSHMPNYIDLVKRSIQIVSKADQASINLVGFMPTYGETLCPGALGMAPAFYHWDLDEVQAARIVFHLRILPFCLASLPRQLFEDKVASIMVLYLQYPSEVVVRACHALFMAYIRGANSFDGGDGYNRRLVGEKLPAICVDEQLVAFYVKTALEIYPALAPFDAFVTVIGAVVQYLPPGNPAILHCIDMLVAKCTDLHEMVSKLKLKSVAEKSCTSSAKDEDSEVANLKQAAERIQELLVHLIPFVDLQVLPELLKAIAKLVLGLPLVSRFVALEQAFHVVGGMDDYTRKHLVNPWFQSLAFLSVENTIRMSNSDAVEREEKFPYITETDTFGVVNAGFRSSL